MWGLSVHECRERSTRELTQHQHHTSETRGEGECRVGRVCMGATSQDMLERGGVTSILTECFSRDSNISLAGFNHRAITDVEFKSELKVVASRGRILFYPFSGRVCKVESRSMCVEC